MNLRLLLALGTLLPTASTVVAPAPQEDPDTPIAARIGSEVITMDEYEDFLVRSYGREPLGRLIDRRLLRDEARRLGIMAGEAEVAEAVERTWASYLERVRGDEAAFVAELERGGFRVDEYRALLAEDATDELLLQAICLRTREVTEDDVEARFYREYGPGGDRVQVRHVFLTPARERAERIAAGVPPSQLGEAALDSLLREKCESILARLEEGADFATLAAEEGHDIGAPVTGGALANYNYRAYGPEFAAAVRAAEVGVPVGPVQTQAGFHVIEVTERVHTELDDVRDDLRRTLAEEPAEFAETEALRERLRAAVEVETY